jgi:phage FluMu gp28-like protein
MLCTFTLPLKREIFPRLRTRFEQRNIRIPISIELREDLHAMQQVITNGQYNYKAPRSDAGHSDRCTALALEEHAVAEGGTGPSGAATVNGREARERGNQGRSGRMGRSGGI